MSRLNPLHELTHPMGRLEESMVRLEGSIGNLRTDMAPIQVLPDVLASLKRVEELMERLVAATEASAGIKPPPASGRAAPRKRGASGGGGRAAAGTGA